MDLDKVEQRVNEVINGAMSKAFEKRDAVMRELERARQQASGLAEGINAARSKIDELERSAAAQAKAVKKAVTQLEVDANTVIRLLATHAGVAEQLGQLVGKLVRIKGGAQQMVAAGLSEDSGAMRCFYERRSATGTEIVDIELPWKALELVAPASKRRSSQA